MEVKVTEYNIRRSPIRWQISISIKFILSIFFSLALAVFEIFAYQKHDLENVGHVKYATMAVAVVHNDIRNVVIRWIVSTTIKS